MEIYSIWDECMSKPFKFFFVENIFFPSYYALYDFQEEKKRRIDSLLLLKIKFVINNNVNQFELFDSQFSLLPILHFAIQCDSCSFQSIHVVKVLAKCSQRKKREIKRNKKGLTLPTSANHSNIQCQCAFWTFTIYIYIFMLNVYSRCS